MRVSRRRAQGKLGYKWLYVFHQRVCEPFSKFWRNIEVTYNFYLSAQKSPGIVKLHHEANGILAKEAIVKLCHKAKGV